MTKFLFLITAFLFSCNEAAALPIVSIEPSRLTSDEYISLEVTPLPNNQFELTLYLAEEITPVLGTAFDLVYDPTIISYKYFKKGEFLEKGGTPIYLILAEERIPSRLISGITLKRTDKLPVGTFSLIHFVFEIKQNGKTAVSFEKNAIFTLHEEQKMEMQRFQWQNGEITLEKSKKSEGIGNDIFNMAKKLKLRWIIIATILFSAIVYFLLIRQKRKSG